MKALRILVFLLCLFGIRWLALLAPSSMPSTATSLYAQTGPIQSKKRPTATKSSNTWICFVTAGAVGIIVFFIGKLDQKRYEAEEERRESMKSGKKKETVSETESDSKEEDEEETEKDADAKDDETDS